MSGLVLSDVAIALADGSPVAAIDLAVAPGEIVTLMGPSGSGKSTILAFAGGFLDPAFRAKGQVRVAGEDVTRLAPERRRIGVLFQDALLFPHLSVGENLAFGLPRAVRGRARREAVDAALDQAGLSGFAGRDPATLSGGQRARVALMRTLLAQPRALLLDEPFSKLDTALRQDIRAFVFEHARARGLPTLLVTHDEADAAAAGGRVIALDPPPRAT